MKTQLRFLLSALFLLFTTELMSQDFTIDSIPKAIPLQYAIPDLPAFNALGTEPNNLLRPSTAKDISITANEFYDGKSIIIPKTFAIEFSPIMLLKSNKLTLADYQKSAAWYNARISFGTLRDSLNLSRVAIGFRTTLIDKADPKNNKNLVAIFDKLNDKRDFRQYYLNYKTEEWIKLNQGKTFNVELMDSVFNDEFNRLYKNKSDSLNTVRNLYEATNLKPYIEEYRNNNKWNLMRLDIAVAAVLASPDSLAKNLKFDSFHAWVTWALPVFGDKGQLLLGATGGCNLANNQLYWNVSIPSRIYLGTNDLKGLVELQYLFKQQLGINNLVARMGCEYRFTGNLWLNFTVGIENNYTDKSSGLVSDFKIIYGI